MEPILSGENLRQAHRAVVRNKGAPGVDGITVEAIAGHMREHWPRIREKLYEGSYQPARVKGVRIPKPSGGERLLGIPTVQDRILQQAVQQQLNGVFEPGFSEHSYGFRPGRSAHQAIQAAQGYVRSGKDWVIDIDISAFFDQVNHDLLMHRVSQKVTDKRVLKLIGRYLRAPMVLDGQIHKREQGTPQGGPLSPLLANIYLDPLDQELERRGLSFCRYADDLTIYVASERSAQRVFESISRWIEKELRLTINRDKSDTGRPWKRQFLGFRITQSGEIGIARSSLESYKTKVRQLWHARQSRTSRELIEAWERYVRGWWNYFGIAKGMFKRLSSWTRRHIRKCFWQRWHNRRGRLNTLKRLGVGPGLLGRVDFYAGAWRAARHPVMHKALSNARLRQYHLLTPHDLALSQKR